MVEFPTEKVVRGDVDPRCRRHRRARLAGVDDVARGVAVCVRVGRIRVVVEVQRGEVARTGDLVFFPDQAEDFTDDVADGEF